jgi:polar amino acid transport system substrate-binding protein
MKKTIIISIILLIMVFGACGSSDDTLIVGTSAGFRPFEYIGEDGKITGFDIDLINEIGKKLNKKVEIKDMDFDALIAAVRSGAIDVIASGMTITEEREKQVDFTIPYFTADQSVLIRNNSDYIFNSVDDLNKSTYKVGVQNDTTGAFWAEDNISNTKIQKYGKYIECIQDLENGNLDMIVLDKPTGEAYTKNRPVKIAMTIQTEEQYGFAVKEGSELKDKINRALSDIMSSDKWKQLNQKYFGVQ